MGQLDSDKLGFSNASLAGYSLPEAAQVGLRMGFRSFEMLAFDGYRHSQGLLAGFYFERLTDDDRQQLRDIADQFEYVSTHAPFVDMAPFSPNPALRDAARGQMVAAIEGVASLGATTTTTHVSAKPTFEWPSYRQEVIDLYRRLGDLAGEAGVTVTIETGWPADIDEFAQLLWDIDHPAIGANVDVGHLPKDRALAGTEEGVARYNDELERHLRSLAGKLWHMHLHDVRASDFRDHRAAGRGIIDYQRLMQVAVEVGFDGMYVFELEEPDLETALRESRQCIVEAVEATNRRAADS